jgi:hypothetical protein
MSECNTEMINVMSKYQILCLQADAYFQCGQFKQSEVLIKTLLCHSACFVCVVILQIDVGSNFPSQLYFLLTFVAHQFHSAAYIRLFDITAELVDQFCLDTTMIGAGQPMSLIVVCYSSLILHYTAACFCL